jgi:MFS family permease
MPARLQGTLWRNADFLRLWSAQTVSQLGSQVTFLALPFVAILVLKATTFEIAALGVVDNAPLLLFALPAGVWVDRLRRRPLMIAADLGRAAALGSIPVVYALGGLTLAQLYVVGFLTGTLTVFFDVAYQSILPGLVSREEIAEANAKLEVTRSAAQVTGPSAAGGLVAALTAPYAIVADAISFVGSAACLAVIRREEPRPESRVSRAPMRREIAEGLRFVLRHPILRPNMTFTATANVFNSIFFAVLLVWAVRKLDLTPGTIGLILSGASGGSLVAAAFAPRLQRRFGVGRTMLIAAFSGWALLLLPLASGSLKVPLLLVPLLVWYFGVVVYNVSSVSLMQAITPERLLGRMNASRRLVVLGTIAPSTLLGGVLGTYVGLRETILIGAAGRALAGLIILRSPVRSILRLEDADAVVASFNEPAGRGA